MRKIKLPLISQLIALIYLLFILINNKIMSNVKILYICKSDNNILPVETKSRELPYKSPLAFLLANLGCKVLIGRQQELGSCGLIKFFTWVAVQKQSTACIEI